MSRTWTFPPLPPKSQEMKIRQETVRKRSLRKTFRPGWTTKRKDTENWVGENGTRIKGSWRRRCCWCRVGDVAFNFAVLSLLFSSSDSWFLRPSQLVEETVEDIKEEPRKKKELFFCVLRLINSAELIRCQSCWDFGCFVRRIFGEKTKKKGEKKKREQMTRMAVSCRARLYGYFRSKQLLGEWMGRQLGEQHSHHNQTPFHNE